MQTEQTSTNVGNPTSDEPQTSEVDNGQLITTDPDTQQQLTNPFISANLGRSITGVAGSALFDAISSNNVVDAMQLLEAIPIESRSLLLHTALLEHDWNKVNNLLDARIGIMDLSPDKRITALYAAVQVNAPPPIVKRMLSFHVPEMHPDFKCITHSVALHVTVEQNVDPVLVELLCKHGANANLLDFTNRTPLYLAIEFLRGPEIVYAMLRGGADVRTQGKKVEPLDLAVQINTNATVLRLLLEYSVGVDFQFIAGLHELATRSKMDHLIPVIQTYAARVNFPGREELGIAVPPGGIEFINGASTSVDYSVLETRICWNCMALFPPSYGPLSFPCLSCKHAHYCTAECRDAHATSHKFVCG